MQIIQDNHCSYDALQYPLIFWDGKDGYHLNIKQRNPTTGSTYSLCYNVFWTNNFCLFYKYFYLQVKNWSRKLVRWTSTHTGSWFMLMKITFSDADSYLFSKLSTCMWKSKERLRYIKFNQTKTLFWGVHSFAWRHNQQRRFNEWRQQHRYYIYSSIIIHW